VVCVRARAALWGDAVTLPAGDGDIALVTQSGNVGVVALAHRDGLGLHTVVSLGNAAVVDTALAIEQLARTDGVRCVAAYVEADGDGTRLAAALAACVERDVHVVVLKAGRSAAGRVAGAAHTAALSGDHEAYRALVEEAGGVLVAEPYALLETARTLAGGVRHRGALAVLTCSGADATVAADLAADVDVPLADLTPATRAALSSLLPSTATVANPLDHTNLVWADAEALRRIGAALAMDPGVGHLIYVQDQPPGLPAADAEEWTTTRNGALAGMSTAGAQPLLVATMPGQEPPTIAAGSATGPATNTATGSAAAPIGGLRNALSGVRALRRRPPDPDRLRAVATAAAATRGRIEGEWLAEHTAKALLATAGVAVPRHRVVTVSPHSAQQVADAVVAAAAELDGPVALKLSAAGLVHKTELGALVVGLTDAAALASATHRLLALPSAGRGTVLLVEQMATGDAEVLVSARCGGVVPTLTLGLGGLWAEALSDVVTLPLPVAPEQVLGALPLLRGAAVLHRRRDRRVLDLGALAVLAGRVGDLLLARELTLVECNPVIVSSAGAVAVDAVVHASAGSGPGGLDGSRTGP
jgi:acetyl-CoA synthetase